MRCIRGGIFASICVLLAACGQGQEAKQAPSTPAAQATAGPVPADFNPCNTTKFAEVEAVIGTRPRIVERDITGAASPGWAICSYGRADESAGPTFSARIMKLESSSVAARRHQTIVGGLTNAQPVAGDPGGAVTWVEGNNLHLQYQSGWWIVRRTIEGQTDQAARTRLLAAPRWPPRRTE